MDARSAAGMSVVWNRGKIGQGRRRPARPGVAPPPNCDVVSNYATIPNSAPSAVRVLVWQPAHADGEGRARGAREACVGEWLRGSARLEVTACGGSGSGGSLPTRDQNVVFKKFQQIFPTFLMKIYEKKMAKLSTM